eukprot:TRINITY_DN42075_c0_g1_i1.p1 TRINITY_DN42075_c0_g1~~TRINITY_DN42075_c0_g1_i1.p1  ORF type:complete len:1448 (+),score=332.88 TRINITY_DN42075_c0_g1_i1:100-4443(+)
MPSSHRKRPTSPSHPKDAKDENASSSLASLLKVALESDASAEVFDQLLDVCAEDCETLILDASFDATQRDTLASLCSSRIAVVHEDAKLSEADQATSAREQLQQRLASGSCCDPEALCAELNASPEVAAATCPLELLGFDAASFEKDSSVVEAPSVLPLAVAILAAAPREVIETLLRLYPQAASQPISIAVGAVCLHRQLSRPCGASVVVDAGEIRWKCAVKAAGDGQLLIQDGDPQKKPPSPSSYALAEAQQWPHYKPAAPTRDDGKPQMRQGDLVIVEKARELVIGNLPEVLKVGDIARVQYAGAYDITVSLPSGHQRTVQHSDVALLHPVATELYTWSNAAGGSSSSSGSYARAAKASQKRNKGCGRTYPLHIAALAGAPASLLLQLLEADPTVARAPVVSRMPLLHFLILNRDNYDAEDWSQLALRVLEVDTEAARSKVLADVSLLTLALQNCSASDLPLIIQIATFDHAGYLRLYRELDSKRELEARSNPSCSPEKTLATMLRIMQGAKTIFGELRKGPWCSVERIQRLLKELPEMASLRVAGEYLLWWSIFFNTPACVAKQLVELCPQAVTAKRVEVHRIPPLHLAIANGFDSSLLARLLDADEAAAGLPVKLPLIAKCSSGKARHLPTRLMQSAVSQDSNCLQLAMAVDALPCSLELLLRWAEKRSCYTDGHHDTAQRIMSWLQMTEPDRFDSPIVMALQMRHLCPQLLKALHSQNPSALVAVMLAIAEKEELRKAIPASRLKMLLAVGREGDVDAAKAALGSRALKKALDKRKSAKADEVQSILDTYGATVASIPLRLSQDSGVGLPYGAADIRKPEGCWRQPPELPIVVALRYDAPYEVLQLLLRAHQDAALVDITSGAQRAFNKALGNKGSYLLNHVLAKLSRVLATEAGRSDARGATRYVQFAMEVFDLAPEVVDGHYGLTGTSSSRSSRGAAWLQQAERNPASASGPRTSLIFELLDMGRTSSNFYKLLPLLKRVLEKKPDVLQAKKDGKTPLMYSVCSKAHPELIRLILQASPAAARDVYHLEPPLAVLVTRCIAFSETESPESLELFRIPQRDWSKERLIWIGHQKSSPGTCIVGALPDNVIRRICSFLGKASVARELFDAAPDALTEPQCIDAIKILLSDMDKPFDEQLLLCLFKRVPSVATGPLYPNSESRSSQVWRVRGAEDSWPLQRVLQNRKTCAPTLAQQLVRLHPPAAAIRDSNGHLPLTFALGLKVPWRSLGCLADELLASSPAAQETASPSSFCRGAHVCVRGYGHATIVSHGPVGRESRHHGKYKVKYHDGSTYHVEAASMTPVAYGSPVLTALRNKMVPTRFVLELISRRPWELTFRDAKGRACAGCPRALRCRISIVCVPFALADCSSAASQAGRGSGHPAAAASKPALGAFPWQRGRGRRRTEAPGAHNAKHAGGPLRRRGGGIAASAWLERRGARADAS